MHQFLTLSRTSLALLCAATFCLPASFAQAQDDDSPKMTIGSKAPDLDIEHWVSDNDGEFKHVTKIEDGKVYIVEFWATWCGPCIASMPHLAETQEKYADKGVQVISISDEDLETVEGFLEKKVRGDDSDPPKTYADLTSTYCLTTDPDKSVMNDYFRAAGQSGIPCAFIVGKSGHVEWIGHPMRMDKPLQQVVEDKWDRDAFLVKWNEEKEAQKKAMEARLNAAKGQQRLQKAMEAVAEKMQDGDEDGAIEMMGDLIDDKKNAEFKTQLQVARLQLMLGVGHDGAADALTAFAKDNKDDAMALNEIAWRLYEQHESKGDVDKKVLAAAKTAAEYAAKADPENGAVLDTLAHLIYVVDDDLDKAIEVQKKALENADGQEADIKPFLDQLLEEKKTGKKAKKEKKSDF